MEHNENRAHTPHDPEENPNDSFKTLMERQIELMEAMLPKKQKPRELTQWCFLAIVLDRIFLLLFLVINIICFITLFPHSLH